MEAFNWVKLDSAAIIGTNYLSSKINEFAQSYKTNFIVTRVRENEYSPNSKYTVEVWYNLNSQCNLINVYCTEFAATQN